MNKLLLFLLVLVAFPDIAFASDPGVLGTSDGLDSIVALLVQGALVIGMTLVVHGLISVYKRAESPQQYPIGYCVANIVSGTLMIIANQAYRWTVNTGAGVNWASDSSMLSAGGRLRDDVAATSGSLLSEYLPPEAMATLMGFIYIAGLIGFLKGLYLLKNVGKMDNQQEGGFAKAFWHMVGGAACMNIVKVGCFIGYFLGFTSLCGD